MDMTRFRNMQLDIEILLATKRTPKRLSTFISDFLMYAQGFSRSDIEGRVDFLANRNLLRLRLPSKKFIEPTYFVQLTDKVPDDQYELTSLIVEVHRNTQRP